jgi:hypothetical protein
MASLLSGGGASEEVLGVSSSDLYCPICCDVIVDAFVTSCGHTFCHACLSTHLRNKRACPSCSTYITEDSVYPNFLLNKVRGEERERRQLLCFGCMQAMQRASP